MKLQVQFAGYSPVDVDTENGTCAVFERLTATEAATALESAIMGDEDDDGWVVDEAGGETFQVRHPR